jgi:hypothetical protein
MYTKTMTDLGTNQPIRNDITGWKTISSGDSDVEILEHRIRVSDFSQATDVANRITPLVVRYEPLDSEYTIHVNLARSAVEVTLSVPKGCWESEAQKHLAEGVIEVTNRQIVQ